MIYKTPNILPLIFPKYVWNIPTEEKLIYLSFDDGPIPDITESVLSILDDFNAKATFFCIGDNIFKHPQIFNKILLANHSIGNHTNNHLKGWNTNTKEYIENIEICHEQILKTYPEYKENRLFRPPYGRIKNSQAKLILDNYKIIMWSVLSQDYNQNIPKEKCLLNTIKATEPGSIVVFHDSIKAQKNMLYVLPRFLCHFQELGYKFAKLGF